MDQGSTRSLAQSAMEPSLGQEERSTGPDSEVLEAVLWIDQPGATFPTGSARSADASPGGATRACSSACSVLRARRTWTWSTRWPTPTIVRGPPPRPGRERGTSRSGHRSLEGRRDDPDRRARRRAGGDWLASACCPAPRPDTIAVPERVDGVPFGAPIADQACDANRTLDEVRARNAEAARAAQAPGRRPPHRPRGLQVAPPDREPLPPRSKRVKRIALRSDTLDRTFARACSIRRR